MTAVVRELKAAARPVETHLERVQVATISAHNDPAIGEKVADALERVGPEGVVSVEEAKGTETVVEVVDGMQFDHGFLSPYFVTDSSSMQVVLEQPWILLHDKRITTTTTLLPILEAVVKSGRPLLIVAEDVESEVLATLVVNKLRGTLSCAAVKAPGYGDQRKAILGDIAALTGATIVADELGVALEKLSTNELGSAKRAVIDKDNTTLVGGGGDRKLLDARRTELRHAIEKNPPQYDRERLEQRLAKLSGGVAVVRVGAPSEAEMRNRKEAFGDAISATKAAVAEGIVVGGGVALWRAARAVTAEKERSHGDERTGLALLERALEAPIRQIAENSGYDGGVVVDRLRGASAERGFDAHTGEYVDMFRAGIVDPTKVVRIALENAASAAGTLLMAEGVLVQVQKADDKAPREAADL